MTVKSLGHDGGTPFELLRALDAFAAAPDDDLQRFAEPARLVDHPAGDQLIEEGWFASEAFVLLEGRITVSREEQPIAELGPGDLVGEIGAVMNLSRTATATATTDVQVAVWTVPRFTALLVELPSIAKIVHLTLADRISANATTPNSKTPRNAPAASTP